MTEPALDSGFVRIETREHVFRITLDRVDKCNALTRAMYIDLGRALDYVVETDEIRVVLIDSNGPMFCAGNDIADFVDRASDSSGAGVAGPALSFIHRMAACDKPIVVAVQGQATGIGLTLLLHADLVVAADDSRFYTAFIDLGLVPEAGSSRLLPALIGRQNTARLLLAGDRLNADEALAMGLIAYRVPGAELGEYAHDLARRLASKPPGAMRATKQLLRDGIDAETTDQQIKREAELFEQRLDSPEVRQIMHAFLDRHPRKST